MEVNLKMIVLCVILLSVYSVTASRNTPKLTLTVENETLSNGEDGKILNFDGKETHLYIFHCHLTEPLNGTFKWYFTKGGYNTYRPAPRSSKQGSSYKKYLSPSESEDFTKLYCVFQYFRTKCDLPKEIESDEIHLNSIWDKGHPKKHDKSMPIKLKVEKNKNQSNVFHVTCYRTGEKAYILEIYKITDNLATWVNDSRDAIAEGYVAVFDNNTSVFCRGIEWNLTRLDGSDNFYRTNYTHLPIYGKVSVTNQDHGYQKTKEQICEKKPEKTVENKAPLDKNEIKIIVAACSSITILIILSTVAFCIWKKCKTKENHTKESKVLYAELEISGQSQGVIPQREETPYAEIVGVLYPAKKLRQKTENVTVEESPYSVPYFNNYSIPVK